MFYDNQVLVCWSWTVEVKLTFLSQLPAAEALQDRARMLEGPLSKYCLRSGLVRVHGERRHVSTGGKDICAHDEDVEQTTQQKEHVEVDFGVDL